MEYYLAAKKNETMNSASKWMDLEKGPRPRKTNVMCSLSSEGQAPVLRCEDRLLSKPKNQESKWCMRGQRNNREGSSKAQEI